MASTKVRGITIELGADTTGLSKALTGVNKEIGSTQKQLKDVERLLKIDPKNTELLEQKQRLLNDRIGETETKLEALKQAQAQVGEELEKTGKGQEQYDALEREIVACENELKNLQKEANESNVALEKVAVAGEKISAVGDKIAGAGKTLAPLSAAAAGIGAGIIKTTADFDASMSKVAAVSGAAGGEFDALRDKAREMGATTKFTASEAAEAMNYMAMAGWKTEQMLGGIEGIMHLAAASGEELGTTSDIVTDALTAFGMKAEDSGRFADILAAAASNANTNVAMMGESFKYAAPVAGSLGYSAEDVSIALGLMANSGIKASMAGTSLRNIFQRMAKPTKESAAAMERLGLSLDDGEGHMYTFREIMNQLRSGFVQINMPLEEYDKTVAQLDADLEAGNITQKNYTKELEELNKQAFGAEGAEKARAAAMLGGSRAMSGLLAIANATEEDYNKLTAAVDNSSQAFAKTKDGIIPLNDAIASGAEILETYDGSAAAMAATMQDNAAGQMEILKSQLEELAIALGDTLMPTLRDLITELQKAVDWLNSLDDDTKKNIMNAILAVAALAPVLSILGNLLKIFGSILTIAPKIGGAFTAVSTAIKGFGATLSGAISSVASFFTADLGAALSAGGVSAVGTAFAAIASSIAAFFGGAELGKKIGAWIFPDDADLYAGYSGIMGTLQMIKDLGIALKDFFVMTWEDGVKRWKSVLNLIGDAFTALMNKLKSGWDNVWNGIKSAFNSIVNSIKSAFTNMINGIISGLNKVSSGISKVSGGRINMGQIAYMAEGGVLTSGTAVVGEAGPELVQVSNGNAMVQPLSGDGDVIGLLQTYLPYLAAGTQMVLDSGALVGGIAPDMNTALGTISLRSGSR